MGRRVVGVSGPLVLIALALGIANCSALDDEETSSSPEVHSPIPVLTPPPGWVLGSNHNNAPVVLEVFLDLVCPDSARAWHMLHQLREDHSDEDLKIIVHTYELPYHRNAYTISQVGSLSHYSSMEIKSDDKASVSYWEAALMLWSWWRHQMETFPALLVLCAANSPVTGEFSSQRPVTQSFDVFFDLRLNRWLNEQSSRRWFETPSRSLLRHCTDAIIMWLCPLEIRNGVSVSDVIVIEKKKVLCNTAFNRKPLRYSLTPPLHGELAVFHLIMHWSPYQIRLLKLNSTILASSIQGLLRWLGWQIVLNQ